MSFSVGGLLQNDSIPFFGMQKAYLAEKDNPLKRVSFQFNPTTISFTRSVNFDRQETHGNFKDPPKQWIGGSPTQLSLSILLDAFEDQPMGSVMPQVEQLMGWTNPDGAAAMLALANLGQAVAAGVSDLVGSLAGGGGGSDLNPMAPDGSPKKLPGPPELKFVWGKLKINGSHSFIGHLTNITVKYELFARDGTPLRATVDLKLASTSEGPARTNPTSGAERSARRHALRAGETVQSVAYAVYGTAAAWRAICEVNKIDNPLRVPVGRELLLPDLNGHAR